MLIIPNNIIPKQVMIYKRSEKRIFRKYNAEKILNRRDALIIIIFVKYESIMFINKMENFQTKIVDTCIKHLKSLNLNIPLY